MFMNINIQYYIQPDVLSISWRSLSLLLPFLSSSLLLLPLLSFWLEEGGSERSKSVDDDDSIIVCTSIQ